VNNEKNTGAVTDAHTARKHNTVTPRVTNNSQNNEYCVTQYASIAKNVESTPNGDHSLQAVPRRGFT